MNALFSVKSIETDWRPPFGKKSFEREVAVVNNSDFERAKGIDGSIFKLLEATEHKALVKYHTQFTLKNYHAPRNHEVWLNKGEEISFTYLWGNKGITKKLVFKGLGNGETTEYEKPERLESDAETEITLPKSASENA